ncbi:MAG: SPW repeat protein [Dermatophilaceae bacterium]
MKKSLHPQDAIPLIAGIYAFLSPVWTTTTTTATWTLVVLGVITAVLALVEFARPDMMAIEGLTVLLGVLFIISPWVMGFASVTMAMAVTAWIVGAVTLLTGLADVSVTRRIHQPSASLH